MMRTFSSVKSVLFVLTACFAACNNLASPSLSSPSLAAQMTDPSLPLATRVSAAKEIGVRRDASAAPELLQIISTSNTDRFPRELIFEADAAVEAIGQPIWDQARINLRHEDQATLDLMFGMALSPKNHPVVISLLPDIAHLTHSRNQMVRQSAADVLIIMKANSKPYLDDLDQLVADQSVIGNILTQSAYTIVSNTDAADPRHVRSAAFLSNVWTQHEFVGKVMSGDIEGVRAALTSGVSPNSEEIAPDAPGGMLYTSTTFGRMGGRLPAAVAAARYNQAEILKLLLAAGATVPALETADQSSEEVRKILQDAGAKRGEPKPDTFSVPLTSPKI